MADDIQNLAGARTENKAFIAYEKRATGPGVDGVYYLEFDRNSEGIIDPDNIFDSAIKLIDRSVYSNNLQTIFLYTNDDGTDVSISIITTPAAGKSRMYTGRIVNKQYVPCDGGNPNEVDGQFTGLFPFYFHNNNKAKFWTAFSPGNAIGGAEAH